MVARELQRLSDILLGRPHAFSLIQVVKLES